MTVTVTVGAVGTGAEVLPLRVMVTVCVAVLCSDVCSVVDTLWLGAAFELGIQDGRGSNVLATG